MAFNIWERWPWTSFQNLNLDWLMKAVKEAVSSSAAAIAKATAVETEVGTYTDQINAANNTANQAMDIARNANEVFFISADAENKAVNYVTWSQGGSGYVTAADIYSAIVTDHKVPIFMDRSQYIYEMAGYETDPNSPLTITRFKFQKDGGNRQDIVWIDSTGSITYTTVYRGAGTFVVNIIHSQSTGSITSDKTYSEISSAYNSGMTVQCHVVDEVRNLEYYAYDCFFTENSETGDYFGWVSPYDYSNTRFYRAFVREDNLVGISALPISGGGGSGVSIQDVIDTVNDGDTNALLYTAQTLSAAQQAQVKQNIGITSGESSGMTQIPITVSGGVYSTNMTAGDLLDHLHTNGCFAVVSGVYYIPVGSNFSGVYGDIYFQSVAQSEIDKTDVEVLKFHMHGEDAIVITAYDRDIPLLTAPPIVDTATGDPARITDGANNYPIKSLIANIDPVQSGSGDPSPTNVRPITGWTEIRITKAITGNTGHWDITLPSNAGIVYGGTLDAISGVLTVDKTIVDMGNLPWTYYGTQQRFVAQVNSGKPSGAGSGLDGACSCYNVVLGVGTPAMPDKSIIIGSNFISSNFAAMVVRDSDYTDAEAFKASVSGQMLVYPIRTPSVYNVATLALKTALGPNGFSADSGAVTVEYYADTKLYIQKMIST